MLRISGALAVAGILGAWALPAEAPCVRPSRPGTQVQGEVKICPGRYRIADEAERGVIIVAGSGTRLDLTGVTLESGDSVPSRFTGVGVLSSGVDQVTIVGGTVQGYRHNVRIEGGRGHRVTGIDVSRSREEARHGTPERFDERDWLDIFDPEVFERYGVGLYLKWTDAAAVTNVTARRAQNGIGLFGARGTYLADNDVSDNSGWGIHLWRASHSTIVRNRAHHNVRCETPAYSRGCDSAALLLREQSDSNVVADNDLRYSGDGFFLSGHRPRVKPSVGNLVVRNDATGSPHNAFESTFSWGNSFIDNRADSSGYGFWLGYSSNNVVRGNSIIGARQAGIAIEHGSDNTVAANVIIGGPVGIHLFAPNQGHEPSRGYRVDDNLLARTGRGVVLEATSRAQLRGNVFDGVVDGIVVDSAASGVVVLQNVFLRASGSFITAPRLDAGHNYWATPDADSAEKAVRGKVTIKPWQPAAAAGY
jgi:parallel beta-helix repeat protein